MKIKIKNAIVSLSDKSKIDFLTKIFKRHNVNVISSGGTYKKIIKKYKKCIEVSKFTGFKEMLDGRVKTLHPKIFSGILCDRRKARHNKDLNKLDIPTIDLVIVNFYPFEEFFSKKNSKNKIIENIDIGGPSLVRAASKNYKYITVITDPSDYKNLENELKKNKGSTSEEFREKMACDAFARTTNYDSLISQWFLKNNKKYVPKFFSVSGKHKAKLRYGENPHQQAHYYNINNQKDFEKIHGKDLSYNNLLDTFSALHIQETFKKNQGTVIIKHGNPSGASIEKNQIISFKQALNSDPISAFGGVLSINSKITKNFATELNKYFFEIIAARGYAKNALKILKKKKNRILIDSKNFKSEKLFDISFFGNTFSLQNIDNSIYEAKKTRIVTKLKPSKINIESLKFAFNICKFTKSNAIVIIKNKSTIGIGCGQPSRLDSCKIAIQKALKFNKNNINNTIAASDAFFPFKDGISELIRLGVQTIIQPGGSIRDKEVIDFVNKKKISMIFTGKRTFKH